MPTEPTASSWDFPDPQTVDSDLIAMGADLEPATVLAAYRAGLFPMGIDAREPAMGWWSPLQRGVLPLQGLRVSRSLRQACRRFEIRVDTAFREVVLACADPSRSGAWIDEAILTAYVRLHRLGWAHSVETWREGRLVGGLYGVAIGGLFAGESMFHRETDASKVALVALVQLLDDGLPRLLDTQWATPHLAGLGVVEITRREYLSRLGRALEQPAPAAFTRPAAGPPTR